MSQIVLIKIILLMFGLIALADAGPSSKNKWLGPHNQARHAVGVRPLKWDPKLARYAHWWGRKMSNDCRMVHSNGPYGENLFWGSGTRWSPRQAVWGWVSENRFYNLRTNSCYGRECGHYKQVVWRDTRRVGCARVVCRRGAGVLLVCEYDPPGNFFGERPY